MPDKLPPMRDVTDDTWRSPPCSALPISARGLQDNALRLDKTTDAALQVSKKSGHLIHAPAETFHPFPPWMHFHELHSTGV